ncbi:MAG: RimK family alpha-L-glutamate ligase, partial [Clostridia bacterium]
NDQFIQISEKVAEILDLDYCGIDLLFGENGEPIVCEVNSNAFFGGIETVTHLNVAKRYAEYIYNLI